jgi:hypothetical protein
MFYFYDLYFIACVVVAFLGRHRYLRFWGNFALALLVTPVVVAVILLLGSRAHPKTPPQSAKTANG